MGGSALHRVRQWRRAPGRGWVLLLSFLAALLMPLLLIDLALLVHLLVSRGGGPPPQDSVLGPLVSGRWITWPYLPHYQLNLLLVAGAGLAFAGLEALTLWWLDRRVHRLALRLTTHLRSAIHEQAFRLGTHDLLGIARSSPERLFCEQAERVRIGLVAWYRAVPSSWIALTLLLLLAVAVNFWLTLFAILLSLYIARMYYGLRTRSVQRRLEWEQVATLNEARLLRTLNLAPMTTGYGLRELPGGSFDERLLRWEEAALRMQTSGSANRPLLLLAVLLGVGLLLIVVGLRPDLSVAGTVLLSAALLCAYFPAARLWRMRQPLREADAAAAEIFAYLDRVPSVDQLPNARPVARLKRAVTLDRITLADRDGHRLLDQVSLSIPVCSRTAILASDPQTPLALAGLFVRFYDPAAGRILYDDDDVRQATLDTVRGQALLVTSQGPLLPGTVMENISCGESGFTTLQITDAARRAEAYDFIQALPQQFQTQIGDHPPLLRPDQAFRIGLARALLREPSLLVIEEPGGHLDTEIVRELERAVAQASEGRTVIVLPALPGTLRMADRVLVFHEGRLEADGKHPELLQTSELYRHINYLRFNAFRQKVKW